MRLVLEWIVSLAIMLPLVTLWVAFATTQTDPIPGAWIIAGAIGFAVRFLVDVSARALFGPRQKKGQTE